MVSSILVTDATGTERTVATADALVTLVGEVQASPTSNTLLDRLKTLGTALTGGTTTAVTKLEDAAHSSGDAGIMALTVRSDAGAATAGTDGDYQPPITDASGRLWVNIGASASSIAKAEDAAHTSADVGAFILTKRTDSAASSAGTDGDYASLNTDSTGRLWANIAASATSIAKAEDAAHTDADVGAFVLTKRTDSAASSAGTDGDYASLNSDASGRVWTRVGANDMYYTEDAAAASDPVGPVILAVRRDTLTSAEVSGDGDNIALKADSRGALHVNVSPTAKSIAKTEDAASADADVGAAVLAVQKATPIDTAGSDGDYEFLQIKNGRLWVSSPPAGATSIAKAEDVASADADVGVPAMARRTLSPTNTSGTDGDYEMLQMSAGRLWASVVTEGPSFTTVWGVTGAPVASSDMSSLASVTDAPTSTQKIVVDKIHASVGSTMNLIFKCETSGAIISGPHYVLANTSLELNFTGPGSKGPKLGTADKKLQCIASVAGNVAINVAYHSEA